MNIKWLGHASFVITADGGTKIITDPYESGGGLSYGEITESADIVTVSHDHFDHNNISAVGGNPQVVKGTAQARGIDFQGIPSFHDDSGGKQRGKNTIFCFAVDGVKICHLGDLGHRLSDEQLVGVGAVDVLLVPVGGTYTIDAAAATSVCEKLKPRVVIPMHYKTNKCDFPIAGVEDFLQGKPDVRRPDSSDIELKVDALPPATRIIVLKPAL